MCRKLAFALSGRRVYASDLLYSLALQPTKISLSVMPGTYPLAFQPVYLLVSLRSLMFSITKMRVKGSQMTDTEENHESASMAAS